jgi:hypothetical protein
VIPAGVKSMGNIWWLRQGASPDVGKACGLVVLTRCVHVAPWYLFEEPGTGRGHLAGARGIVRELS